MGDFRTGRVNLTSLNDFGKDFTRKLQQTIEFLIGFTILIEPWLLSIYFYSLFSSTMWISMGVRVFLFVFFPFFDGVYVRWCAYLLLRVCVCIVSCWEYVCAWIVWKNPSFMMMYLYIYSCVRCMYIWMWWIFSLSFSEFF